MYFFTNLVTEWRGEKEKRKRGKRKKKEGKKEKRKRGKRKKERGEKEKKERGEKKEGRASEKLTKIIYSYKCCNTELFGA